MKLWLLGPLARGRDVAFSRCRIFSELDHLGKDGSYGSRETSSLWL